MDENIKYHIEVTGLDETQAKLDKLLATAKELKATLMETEDFIEALDNAKA